MHVSDSQTSVMESFSEKSSITDIWQGRQPIWDYASTLYFILGIILNLEFPILAKITLPGT